MIQRIQTIWLLLAAILGFTSLKTAFFIGSITTEPANHLTGMSNVWLMISTIVGATVATLSIFLYKNRPLQLKLVLLALGISLLTIGLYYLEINKYAVGGLALWCVVVIAIPVVLILATIGIYKDEQLVKSTDRLR
jgi:hypothetical protein